MPALIEGVRAAAACQPGPDWIALASLNRVAVERDRPARLQGVEQVADRLVLVVLLALLLDFGGFADRQGAGQAFPRHAGPDRGGAGGGRLPARPGLDRARRSAG
jgi:hypothetical protein